MTALRPSLRAAGLAALLSLSLVAIAAAQQKGESPIAPALKNADAAVARIISIPKGQRTFDNTMGAMDDMFVQLENETGSVIFLAYVHPDAAVREKGQRAEKDLNNWKIALGKNEQLYNAVKEFADTNPKLEGEQARLLKFSLRDYKRAGMMLPADKREELKKVEMELNTLGLEFDKNIREDESVVPLLASELAGVPEDVLKNQKRAGDLYLCGLDYPTYFPIITNCTVEATRAKMMTADRRKGGQRNVTVLQKILALRQKQAKLLGYAHPADYETEVRMAKNAATVMSFYEKVVPLIRKKCEQDVAEFTELKRAETKSTSATFAAWDRFYYEEKAKREKYAVDSTKVQEYFPMDRAIEGLFNTTQKIYGLEYREIPADQAARNWMPTWHPDVRLFEVYDKASNKLMGAFFIDLYPRENKYGHAAQFGIHSRKVWKDRLQVPMVALVCNFTKPTADKPSLLTHEEVKTFFHEFGHCLHSILTETTYGAFSGTNVARDFVEAPSQMFENWCYDVDVLSTFAKHYKTGEPIPAELVANIVRAKRVGSGIWACGQAWYGMTDMKYHSIPEGRIETTKIGLDLWRESFPYPPIDNTYFEAGFGHLVGYQAGYYGYMWSQVYAQDMLTPFLEKGLLNPDAGMAYRKKILARGGTMDEFDMIKDYLGREPKMEPFLDFLGLKK